MASIPPGLPHALRYLAIACVPLLMARAAMAALQKYFDLFVPLWISAILQAISLPLFMAGRIQLRNWRQRHAAARLGAILPPSLSGKWVGNVDLLLRLQRAYRHGYLGDGLNEAHDELGVTFNLPVLWDNNICTTDANVIKGVLATDFANFVKGENFQAFMLDVLGTGVFNADGEMWKFHRSMTRPFFSRDRISHFDIFERHSGEAIEKMKTRLAEGYSVDFQDLVSRFTLDSASEFLFGTCVKSLDATLPFPYGSPQASDLTREPSGNFAMAFSRAQETVTNRGRLGYIWPWFEVFRSKTAADMKVIDAFLEPILQEALEKLDKSTHAELKDVPPPSDIGDDETLLDHLVKYTTDRQVLHDEILNILIAGRDTTAGTLTFAVYFLCLYPHVFRRLRQEILDTVGPTRRPDYDDIKVMKYLRAFLNETLRLYPAVPFNIRFSVNDTTAPNPNPGGLPFFIPAGTPVTYSVILMHRRTDYWGPDAHQFDPDRFLDDRLKYLLANPFIFLPFNAGPRICLGQQFAYNEMSFFLIRLLQSFASMSLDLESQDPHTRPPREWAQASGRKAVEKIFPKSHLTAYSNGGLWVRMGQADITNTE